MIFEKKGRIKIIFEKCTSGAVAHDVKSLPPRGTAAGACFQRQGGARGARTLPQTYRRATRRHGLFLVFSFFKKLLTFLKTTN
jgi:hypothetical protein